MIISTVLTGDNKHPVATSGFKRTRLHQETSAPSDVQAHESPQTFSNHIIEGVYGLFLPQHRFIMVLSTQARSPHLTNFCGVCGLSTSIWDCSTVPTFVYQDKKVIQSAYA